MGISNIIAMLPASHDSSKSKALALCKVQGMLCSQSPSLSLIGQAVEAWQLVPVHHELVLRRPQPEQRPQQPPVIPTVPQPCIQPCFA